MERYPSYKDSGAEWIGEIPAQWEISELKRYCTKITDGSHFSPSIIEKGYPYITVKDISEHSIDFDNCKKISHIDYQILVQNGCKPETDDILITKDGTIGRGIVVKENSDFVILSSLGLIRPNPKNYNSQFLKYYLLSNQNVDQMYSYIQGSALTRITIDIIKKLLVILPTLPEQEAIASYLDRKTKQIDDLIAKKERLIELKKEERTAIINQSVTKGLDPDVPMKDSGIEWLGAILESWDSLSMKHVCQNILDGTHGSYKRVEDGYRLLSVRNIINDEFVFREDDSRVSEEDFNDISSRLLIREGDVQLAIVGATIGKAALVKDLPELFVTQRSVATLRVNEKCLAEYLYYFIKTSHFQSFLWLHAGFSAQPGIYLGTIQNCPLPLPSVIEQKEIVKYIDKHEGLFKKDIDRAAKQINLLKEYKTTLISEAVTGKTKVL